jgi:hypothetical protein
MFKKYSPRIKELYNYRSYKIVDLCKIHKSEKLHPQSIRKWIKKGELKAFMHERDYYIYGAVWKEFLTNRNKQQKEKRKLKFDQFICFKCKSNQPPLNNVITKLTTGFNGCIEAFGVCQKCGNEELKRSYKRSELAKIKEIFKIELDELSSLCNSSTSTNKTHSNISQKMGGSESLNIANNKDKKPKSTNINQSQQLTLFDFIN